MNLKQFAEDNARLEFRTALDRANDVIRDLVGALAAIQREAEKGAEARTAYIVGAAECAIVLCNRQRVRNRHGYLEVR